MAESPRGLHRGDVWDADLPDDIGRHHAVLLSRDVAMARRHRAVVVLVTSNVLGKRTEVAVGPEEGLDYECVIDADDLYTLSTGRLLRRRGALGSDKLAALEAALHIALGLRS